MKLTFALWEMCVNLLHICANTVLSNQTDLRVQSSEFIRVELCSRAEEILCRSEASDVPAQSHKHLK